MPKHLPLVGITHRDGVETDLATVFLGLHAQVHCQEFLTDLQTSWLWGEEFSHQPLSGQDWNALFEQTRVLFIMAESFQPAIRDLLLHARQYGVIALILTPDAESFPADIVPLLAMDHSVNFSAALRALIGGAVKPGLIGIDFADVITIFIQQARRLIQYQEIAPAASQLHLSVKRAMNQFSRVEPSFSCVMVAISAGDDLLMEDYYQVMRVLQKRISETCQVIVAIDLITAAGGEARVVVTAGWN